MTGLVRNRAHRSSTWARAVAWSAASSSKRMLLAGADPGDAVEAQRGQRTLDGGALGIGDAGAQLHVDVNREDHAPMLAHRRRAVPIGRGSTGG